MKERTIALLWAIIMIAILSIMFYGLEFSMMSNSCIFQNLRNGHIAIVIVFGVFLFAMWLLLYHLVRWIWHANRTNRSRQNIKLLGSIMLLLWTIGWVLFIQSFLYFPSSHQFVNAELLLRSAIASLNLFMLDIDSNVLDQMNEHPQLKGAISFVSILSFLCTIALLLSLVSARLQAHIKLYSIKIKKNCPHLYLFFGLNEQTEILAQSVRDNDRESVRIVVEQNNKNFDDERNGWEHVLSIMTHRRESFRKVRDIGAQLSLTSVDISEINTAQKDIWGEINLELVKKQICRLSKISTNQSRKLHIFFLSDNEENNILSTGIIREDELIKSVSSQGVHVVIYCHARYDSVNRVIEESNPLKNVEVRIIDSSRLSIELLKRNVVNHPVKFVEIDGVNNPGTVKSAFNSLVVGFGETGRDAVRFLYEYGAFMSSDSSNDVVNRSEFHCYIVDKDMASQEGTFTNSASEAVKSENADGSKMLQFIQADTSTTDFYRLLQNITPSLNYVVISKGIDNDNMTLAVRIMKYVMANGNNLKNFRILIQIHNNTHVEHFHKIANHYNLSTGHTCMEIFGVYKDIFSYQFVVADQFREDAKVFYDNYQKVMQENEAALKSGTWEERRDEMLGFCKKVVKEIPIGEAMQRYNEGLPVNEKMSPTGLCIGFEYIDDERLDYPKYENLRKLRRQTEQDMSNAWHKLTKRELIEESINRNLTFAELHHKIQELQKPENGKEYRHKYDILGEKISTLILNLAITEHLRWNASHEMLGYKRGNKTDELLQHHNCLVSWEDLNKVSAQACKDAIRKVQNGKTWEYNFSKQIKEEHSNYKDKVKAYVLYLPDYKKYDFAVVETTIALLKKDIENGINTNKY